MALCQLHPRPCQSNGREGQTICLGSAALVSGVCEVEAGQSQWEKGSPSRFALGVSCRLQQDYWQSPCILSYPSPKRVLDPIPFLELEPRHGVSMTPHVAWSTIFFEVQKAYGMLWRTATMSQSHKMQPSPWRTWTVTSSSWAQNWLNPQKIGRRYRQG